MKKILNLFSFSIAMIIMASITWVCTKNNITVAIAALSVFALSLLTRSQYVSRRIFATKKLQALLTVSTLSGIVFMLSSSAPKNAWGEIGWTAYCSLSGLCLGLIFYGYLSEEDNLFSFVKNHNFFSLLTGSLLFLGILSFGYLFWGTQYIWIPVALFVIGFCSVISFEKNWLTDRENIEVAAIALVIGIISTVYQFWNSTVWFQFKLWALLLFGLVLTAIIFLITLAVKWFLGVPERRKIKQQLVAEREKQKRLAEEEQKEAEERKVEMEKLFQSIIAGEKENLVWNDIYMLWAGRYRDEYFDKKESHILLSSIDFLSVLEISKIKKQITWEPGLLDFALRRLNAVFGSFDDSVLTKAIENLKKVETYSEFNGYEKLKKTIMDVRRYQNIYEVLYKSWSREVLVS